MAKKTLADQIFELELELATQSVRNNRARISQLLRDDFVEFGASGRRFTKTEILNMLADEEAFTTYHMQEFHVAPLADTVVLATYVIPERKDAHGAKIPASRRSSVWKLAEGRWQILFHQGTRLPT